MSEYVITKTNLKLDRPDYIQDNWVNDNTWEFLSSLSFDGYILVGNSVANMYECIPLQGDLDFWVSYTNKFVEAFDFISKYYSRFNLYPSMVEMYNDPVNPQTDLPKINLILTQLNTNQVIERFDFPYCKCWWTPADGVNVTQMASESINKKLILFTNPDDPNSIKYKRILKAIKYGYTFTNEFWSELNHLISNPDKKASYIKGFVKPHPITLEDLDLAQFELVDIPIKITDKTKFNKTLMELALGYEKLALTPNVKLPILLKFDSNEIKLLKDYIRAIVFSNPLSDTHYLEVRIGSYHVNLTKRYDIDMKINRNNSNDLEKKYIEGEFDEESNKEVFDKLSSKMILTSSEPVTRTILLDDRIPKVIPLNESGSAYILVDYLPEELSSNAYNQFGQMWVLHPESRHKIIMYEKEVEVNRYSKSYLNTWTDLAHTSTRSYMYSGFDTSTNNDPLPEHFVDYYKWVREQDPKYNQVIANWYEDKFDYIAPHSDCVRGMIPGAKIAIMSFYSNIDPDNFRFLELRSKVNTESLVKVFKIRLDHGTVITMCGNTQELFVHGIPKSESDVCKRISLSFRQMADK